MVLELSDILSGISILIVFITVFADILGRSIDEIIVLKKPSQGESDYCNNLKKKYAKYVPLTFIFFAANVVIFYLLLPTSVYILSESKISIWKFDLGATLFIVIELGILILVIFAISMLVKILKRKKEVFKN
jgi:hypothetical protein